MSQEPLNNLNVAAQELLTTPAELKERLPVSDTAAATVHQGRETIRRILDREDPRLEQNHERGRRCSRHTPSAHGRPVRLLLAGIRGAGLRAVPAGCWGGVGVPGRSGTSPNAGN